MEIEDLKASKGKRFLNYIIDYVSVYLVIFIVGFIIAIIGYGFAELTGNYELSLKIDNFFDSLDNVNPLLDRILTATFYIIYIFLVEYLTKGRSLGKLITGTMVVTTDAEIPSATTFLKRNVMRLIPFDQLSFLRINGWHDSLSNTRVVDKREFETYFENSESILDSIGENEEEEL
ncbi:MAG: RDD family protein [Flavobacteriales bacterium]|nr:RDD family protein [Flavobacteriales bacterium]